ncbi:MAG: phosphoribosylanthranilate isomerase [Opitutia bacterium]|nr:phosphoribosylanthranilate isomerase [Opitutales bacterium]PHX79675.1 MAG: phosphoribosylanthranilate isomerase [Opitutae bacterium]
MIGKARIKVCGITRAADAALALAQGADFLGINCWSGSPRFVPTAARSALLREIPPEKRVAVTVNPTVAEAVGLIAEGFAIVQAHFDPAQKECDPRTLSVQLGVQRLWLAPKLADGAEWPADLIPLAEGFVHDAHAKDAFGGTGKISDWSRFQKLTQKYPQSLWILAGGLGPDNIAAAAKSGATFFDLNSGIELAPGLKSVEKMAVVSEILLKNNQT